jgi:hypothetical protein
VTLDRGLSYDVIDASRRINEVVCRASGANFSHGEILTDGAWYWYAVLIYYVKEYHVAVDPDFIQHAKNMRWAIDCNTIDVRNVALEEPVGKAAFAAH